MLSRRAAIGYVATTVLLGVSSPALAARGASFQDVDSNGDGKVDLDEIKKAAAAKFDALASQSHRHAHQKGKWVGCD